VSCRTHTGPAHLRKLQLKLPERSLFTCCSLLHIEHLHLMNVQNRFTVADIAELLRLRILSAPVTAHRVRKYFVVFTKLLFQQNALVFIIKSTKYYNLWFFVFVFLAPTSFGLRRPSSGGAMPVPN
jgi:hypothetical protein